MENRNLPNFGFATFQIHGFELYAKRFVSQNFVGHFSVLAGWRKSNQCKTEFCRNPVLLKGFWKFRFWMSLYTPSNATPNFQITTRQNRILPNSGFANPRYTWQMQNRNTCNLMSLFAVSICLACKLCETRINVQWASVMWACRTRPMTQDLCVHAKSNV